MFTVESPIAKHLAARARVASEVTGTTVVDRVPLWAPLAGYPVSSQRHRPVTIPEWDVLPRRQPGPGGDDTVLVRMVRQRLSPPAAAGLGSRAVPDLRRLSVKVHPHRPPLRVA